MQCRELGVRLRQRYIREYTEESRIAVFSHDQNLCQTVPQSDRCGSRQFNNRDIACSLPLPLNRHLVGRLVDENKPATENIVKLSSRPLKSQNSIRFVDCQTDSNCVVLCRT